jgi:hypothetical protein
MDSHFAVFSVDTPPLRTFFSICFTHAARTVELSPMYFMDRDTWMESLRGLASGGSSVNSVLRKIRKGLFLAVLGAGLTTASAADPQTEASLANQAMANRIAMALRMNTSLHHFAVTVTYTDGAVDVSGTVADSSQREILLRQIQGTPGVDPNRLADHLVLAPLDPIKQIQGSGSEPTPDKPVLLPAPPDLRAQAPVQPPVPEGASQEPLPIFQAPPPSAMDVGSPRMPPYAWPTYAPYDNFSRVGYPLAYPYQSWPFIGPFYPFPKIPPGWRSVRLDWEDGYWWFSKTANKHDWWHLRFW